MWRGQRYVATTTGTSVSVAAAPWEFRPVLQAQDGSFVGTMALLDAGSGLAMVSIDATGKVRWTVAGNWQPQIATDDGGVIATELDSDGNTVAVVTFDQNGNATGMTANLPTQSWLGYTYQVGSVDQELMFWYQIASSWWAIESANQSRNNAAKQQRDFGQDGLEAACTCQRRIVRHLQMLQTLNIR